MPPHEQESEPTALAALRAAAGAFADDFGRFLAISALWLAAAVLALLLGRWQLVLNGLLVLLVPVTCALGRMAAYTVRERRARFLHVREGVALRWSSKLALGGAQLIVLGIVWLNVELALAAQTTWLVVAAVASVNLGLVVLAFAVATWPLLLDPARDHMRLRDLLRLGGAVALIRPGRMVLLLVVGVVVGAISLQTVVGALVLVPLAVLSAAHLVVPAADGLSPPRPTEE